MPFGMRDVLAALLVFVRGLRGKREGRKAAIVRVVNFCIIAEEADEVYFVQVHDGVSMFEFPILLGSRRAEPSERPRLPSAKLCIYGGSTEGGNRNPKGGVAEAEGRGAAGRRIGPKQCPSTSRDTFRETPTGAKFPTSPWLEASTLI